MTGTPPSNPPERDPKRKLVELRIANLQNELKAEADPERQAALLYEAGSLCERQLEDRDTAIAHYEHASRVHPPFEPARLARIRLLERDGRTAEALRLTREQARSAGSAALRGAAAVDAALGADGWSDVHRELSEAMTDSPSPVIPALLLEWQAEENRDAEALREALTRQAEETSHPALRGTLWIDLALCLIDAERIDEALQALDEASEEPSTAWQARSLQLQVARQHRRWESVALASTSLATQLERATRTDPEGRTTTLVLPIAEVDRLPMAALLLQEAAGIKSDHLSDLEGAIECLKKALAHLPDDVELRHELLWQAVAAGDETTETESIAWFRQHAPEDGAFVAYRIARLVEADDINAARAEIEMIASGSAAPAVQAARQVVRRRAQAMTEHAETLQRSAGGLEGEAQARPLWHAAQILSENPKHGDHAMALYQTAATVATTSKIEILREAYGGALRAERYAIGIEFCDALLEHDIEPSEREALLYSKYLLARRAGLDYEARQHLSSSLSNGAASAWAPFVAWTRAAWERDPTLLGAAHVSLADQSLGDISIGHLCAAAHAYAKGEHYQEAASALARALEQEPGDLHVSKLLERVLRDAGELDEMVSVVQSRATYTPDLESADRSLLVAGATAARHGNPRAARRAYEQAQLDATSSVSASLALADLAEETNDETLLLQSFEYLATDEKGAGSLYDLSRADRLASHRGQEELAANLYMRGMADPVTALDAALGLLSLPRRQTTDAQRKAAYETMARQLPVEQRATVDGSIERVSLEGAEGTLSEVVQPLYMSSPKENGTGAAQAWLRLSELAPVGPLETSLRLQGLRATQLLRGAEAADDLFIAAQASGPLADQALEAAIAIDEALAPGDDPEFRASALRHRIEHCGQVGRPSMQAGHFRALVEADRGAEAVGPLCAATDGRPEDISIWETLRVAARQGEQWPLVAQACERLAQTVDGPLRADLLEEAAVVRLDQLDQEQQAEDLFRRALGEDPSRGLSFHRLHDLLARHEDTEGLEALICDRLTHIDALEERAALIYERACLLRGFSDRSGALDALRQLFELDPNHMGGIALAAEVHASAENWEGAVHYLQQLSEQDIPAHQKRVAHLGAADFLEKHLNAKERALGELRAIGALGLGDPRLYRRMAALAEALDDSSSMIDALHSGFSLTNGPEAAGFAIQAAEHLAQDPSTWEECTQWWRRAIAAEPTDRTAITALAGRLENPERRSAIEDYERAVWAEIERGHIDRALLEGLRNAAAWLGDPDRATAVEQVVATVEVDDPDASSLAQTLAELDPRAFPVADMGGTLMEVVRQLEATQPKMPGLLGPRYQSAAQSPVESQLKHVCRRFDLEVASVSLSGEHTEAEVRSRRDGTLHWVLPLVQRQGLDGAALFKAGRLAWATPRGATLLLEGTAEEAARVLAFAIRASGCRVEEESSVAPHKELRPPRGARRSIRDLLGSTEVTFSMLVGFAAKLQQSADRAGLIVSANFGSAAPVLLQRTPSVEDLCASTRAIEAMRFWISRDSPLWKGGA